LAKLNSIAFEINHLDYDNAAVWVQSNLAGFPNIQNFNIRSYNKVGQADFTRTARSICSSAHSIRLAVFSVPTLSSLALPRSSPKLGLTQSINSPNTPPSTIEQSMSVMRIPLQK
jgi:hypothetical protein